MKKNLLRNVMLFVAVLFASSLFAQDWVKMMQDQNTNFYDVQKAFGTYYEKAVKIAEREAKKERRAKGERFAEGEVEVPGYEVYKRWEHFMQPRVSMTGERFDPSAVWQEMSNYKKKFGTYSGAGNWTLVGPTNPSVPSGGGGAGRVNFLTVHPTIPTTMWCGSPGGGLWKTTDGGTTWTTNTDKVAQVIGCTDLAIDPTNPNTMYLVTGDGEAGDTYTVGLLKSTDGGTTWNTTGLSFNVGQTRMMSKIIIDPSVTSTLYVATSAGIYKSTDAAATFSLSLAGSFKDLELRPGTTGATAVLYATGGQFQRTTNGGTTWTAQPASLPVAANVQRMAVAVSNANPLVVYVITAKPVTYDLEGLYKSTDGGTTFTKLTVGSAIIGTQGFYALSMEASPTNANELIVGGLDVWRCANVPSSGTATFTKTSDWTGSGAPYVHADIHELVYSGGTTFFVCCDGGVFKTTNSGGAYSDLSNGGLQISEMYGFGQSATNSSLFVSGWQDNGTVHASGGSWSRTMGGDGMLAFISWGNDQNQWGSIYNGALNRSTNGGLSFSGCTSGITDPLTTWVTEWNEDPTTANTIYAGFANVWKSTSGGTSWTKLGTIGTGTTYVQAIAAVPNSSSQTIFAAKGSKLYKTTNGGTTWTAVNGLPVGNISDIVAHPTNPQKVWVTFSGFSNKDKVYQSVDQGATWTNLSGSIPNIPVNCIAVDKNGNDALYIGTDGGSFFKDATMTVWQPFNNGLPNVNVSQIEMYYTGNKIRCSTYGRGIWESTLYAPGAYPPSANFSGSVLIGCPGLGVQFTDYSAGQPTSWSWTFTGGNPASSTAQNPFVVYNTPGVYPVTLTATNVNGNNAQTFTNYITVNSSPHAPPTAAGKIFCGPGVVNLTATPSFTPGTVHWYNQPAGGTLLATGNNYSPNVTNGTTTFYVDETFAAGGIDFVGAADNTIGAGAMFTANDIRGLYFDVTKPVIINSVQVYSQTAGMRTIEIKDGNGNLVTDTTVNVPASPSALTTVTINRTVYPGTGYMIKFRGLVDCYRNTAGGAYPYTDGGSNAVSITGSNAGLAGYYYFFYNWQFTNIVCGTARTPVLVTDTCNAVGINDLFVNNHIDVYPNPNNGLFNVAFSTPNIDNYTVKVSDALGQTVYEERLNDFSGVYSNKIDISFFRKGIYMLSVSNSKNQSVKKVIVY